MYIIRLDDASEYMDIEHWDRMEILLDKYDIRPIVGVIPNCKNPKMIDKYARDFNFWAKVKKWEEKGWTIALHGYDHCYISESSGINPIHHRSEFAGVDLEIQKLKIRNGVRIFIEHNIYPKLFFAPGHTFDRNTIEALRSESNIRIISDTIASNVYCENGFVFIPQQSGKCRRLPVKVATFCQHPNIMDTSAFLKLEDFLKNNINFFGSVEELCCAKCSREIGLYDILLRKIYYAIRHLRDDD